MKHPNLTHCAREIAHKDNDNIALIIIPDYAIIIVTKYSIDSNSEIDLLLRAYADEIPTEDVSFLLYHQHEKELAREVYQTLTIENHI